MLNKSFRNAVGTTAVCVVLSVSVVPTAQAAAQKLPGDAFGWFQPVISILVHWLDDPLGVLDKDDDGGWADPDG